MTEEKTIKLIETALKKTFDNQNKSRIEINWNMILQALIIAGILYLTTAFNEGKNNDIIQTKNLENVQSDVRELKEDFKKFSDAPRYTKDNATSDLLPIVNKLNQIDNDVDINSNKINELTNKYQEFELQLGLLKVKQK